MENINSYISEKLVSIVMPAYNCQEFIGIALDSVINQKYKNWELIVVDDCSTDNTSEIVRNYIKKDERIKYYRLNKNSGAAIARNTAVKLANGEYMAFLDSDDVWFTGKLSKQISFMEKNNYSFTCTNYIKIDEKGNYLNKIVGIRKQSNYNDILKKNPGNSTVIYNVQEIGKVIIPNIRKRNDYVMWLQVIKKSKILYGLEEPLASHRIREGSLSKKKSNLVLYHWLVYRKIEKLSLIKSSYLVAYWSIITIFNLRK